MPKILYLVTEDWFFVSHFLPIARAAATAGLDVAVATRVADHATAIRKAGFRLIEIDSERGSMGPLKALRYLARAFAVIRDEDPDIVYCIGLRCVILGGIAAKLARVRGLALAPTGLGHLWLQHGVIASFTRSIVRVLVGSWLRGPRTRYVFENRDDPEEFRLGANDPDITILGGAGVDPDAFPMSPEPAAPPIRVAVVARMIRPKGIVDAIEAVVSARELGAAVELDLFGAPDPLNPTTLTEADLRGYSTKPGICWRGQAKDVAQVWREHNIALLLSHREGLPRTLVEAAACGRAIIATDVAGCREVVRNDKEGYLVPRGDINAAARALIALAASDGLRKEMGIAANARFRERFTEERVKTEIVKLYRSLCCSL
jgi:Glycosyl transferases group 1/Glycosyl transferase 4-like